MIGWFLFWCLIAWLVLRRLVKEDEDLRIYPIGNYNPAPDTRFDLQCFTCGTITNASYGDAVLTCPKCGTPYSYELPQIYQGSI